MIRILFLLIVVAVANISLVQPWIGVLACYFIAIFGPQFVYFWAFEGLRPYFWVLVPTLIGWILGLARGTSVSFRYVSGPIPILFGIWLAGSTLSYFTGPFIGAAESGPLKVFDPRDTLIVMYSQVLVLIMAITCINDLRKLEYSSYIIIITVIYMTYWANDKYLSGVFYGSRMEGPKNLQQQALYSDENAFALVFVMGAPFLYYLGFYFKRAWVRYGMWLVIPFAWHAIFLTGSRGGLVGVVVTLLVVMVRGRQFALGSGLMVLFVIAYLTQAGDSMKSRADTISNYEADRSAVTRLEAWETGWYMILDHPITGVGLVAFRPAFPSYTNYKPRVAHNTPLEIAAESGIFAGLAWLGIVGFVYLTCRRASKRAREADGDEARLLFLLSESVIASMAGYAVCAMFLSLRGYELFYYLAFIAHACGHLSRNLTGAEAKSGASPPLGAPANPPDKRAGTTTLAGRPSNIYVRNPPDRKPGPVQAGSKK